MSKRSKSSLQTTQLPAAKRDKPLLSYVSLRVVEAVPQNVVQLRPQSRSWRGKAKVMTLLFSPEKLCPHTCWESQLKFLIVTHWSESSTEKKKTVTPICNHFFNWMCVFFVLQTCTFIAFANRAHQLFCGQPQHDNDIEGLFFAGSFRGKRIGNHIPYCETAEFNTLL